MKSSPPSQPEFSATSPPSRPGFSNFTSLTTPDIPTTSPPSQPRFSHNFTSLTTPFLHTSPPHDRHNLPRFTSLTTGFSTYNPVSPTISSTTHISHTSPLQPHMLHNLTSSQPISPTTSPPSRPHISYNFSFTKLVSPQLHLLTTSFLHDSPPSTISPLPRLHLPHDPVSPTYNPVSPTISPPSQPHISHDFQPPYNLISPTTSPPSQPHFSHNLTSLTTSFSQLHSLTTFLLTLPSHNLTSPIFTSTIPFLLQHLPHQPLISPRLHLPQTRFSNLQPCSLQYHLSQPPTSTPHNSFFPTTSLTTRFLQLHLPHNPSSQTSLLPFSQHHLPQPASTTYTSSRPHISHNITSLTLFHHASLTTHISHDFTSLTPHFLPRLLLYKPGSATSPSVTPHFTHDFTSLHNLVSPQFTSIILISPTIT
ncbi:hypothetical protein C7M84_016829 [Penaeus vannamei]|uniref:Uncharacterized protein n=1 Tax=Penaeus vannamei TaxID=6689 RepID=A0A423SLT9_PENVA|nr:hypothetical protein C7M84_016829 [Penaeus vannamei]